MTKRAVKVGIVALALVLMGSLLVLGSGHPKAMERAEVRIVTAAGSTYAFNTEVVRTKDEMAHGLMDRPSLPADNGMLFVNKAPIPMIFWMKNTLIPLDMLFIAGDGRIANIAANAEPQSLTTRPSSGPVIAVLELNGGVAAHLGITTGDRVSSEALPKP